MNQFTMRQQQRQGSGFLSMHDLELNKNDCEAGRVASLKLWWDKNIDRSQTYKDKYSPLVADLSQSFTVFHYSVEVSVRGQLTGNNRARLKSFIFKSCREARTVTKSMTKIVSKAALLTSFSLFNARKEPSWISPPPLVVK